jgi:hypothetical protein
MVFLPYLLKAAPAVTSLLSSAKTQDKNKSSQQDNFAGMLQSALNAGSTSAASTSCSQATIKPEEIKNSANAILETIKKKIATPDAYSMTPGIVNLPQAVNARQAASDAKKLTAATDALNSAAAATPVKPLIEGASQAVQVNIFSDDKSIMVSATPSNQTTLAALTRIGRQHNAR